MFFFVVFFFFFCFFICWRSWFIRIWICKWFFSFWNFGGESFLLCFDLVVNEGEVVDVVVVDVIVVDEGLIWM